MKKKNPVRSSLISEQQDPDWF